MGAKVSNDISSEITHQIHPHPPPKTMHSPWRGEGGIHSPGVGEALPRLFKNCENSNFGFVPFFFFFSFSLTWTHMGLKV